VDEVGVVLKAERNGDSRKIWISASDKISWGVAPKGSVAVDGVSLTVIDCDNNGFSIGLIPATLRETTLGSLERGGRVNVEIDVMARYIARLSGRAPAETRGGMTREKLAGYGWADGGNVTV
jgi:riboflavin synthase